MALYKAEETAIEGNSKFGGKECDACEFGDVDLSFNERSRSNYFGSTRIAIHGCRLLKFKDLKHE